MEEDNKREEAGAPPACDQCHAPIDPAASAYVALTCGHRLHFHCSGGLARRARRAPDPALVQGGPGACNQCREEASAGMELYQGEAITPAAIQRVFRARYAKREKRDYARYRDTPCTAATMNRVRGVTFRNLFAGITEAGVDLLELFKAGIKSYGELEELGFLPERHLTPPFHAKVPPWMLWDLYCMGAEHLTGRCSAAMICGSLSPFAVCPCVMPSSTRPCR